jgi:hypothetical protein
MASPPVLRPAVDDLLDALSIRPKEFLPSESDLAHPFIPRPDFNRGNAYEVIKGDKPLTAKMAHKLRRRLQMLLEFAIDDREETERIVAGRAGYERTPMAQREATLLMLLGAAIRERSASAARIEERREAVRRRKVERAAYGITYQDALLEQLDAVIAERRLKGNLTQLSEKLYALCGKPGGLLTRNKGRYDIVDVNSILSRFGARPEREKESGAPGRPDRTSRLLEVTWNESPESFPREQLLRFAEILRKNGFEVIEVESAEEGCTTVRLSVRSAKTVGDSLQAEELRRMGIVGLREQVVIRGSETSSPPIAGRGPTAHGAPLRRNLLQRQLNNALRRERFTRPWRRLRALVLPSVAQSPQWHTIAESDDRAYAHPLVPAAWKSLRVDLGMTLFWWPAVTVLALLLVLLPLPAGATTLGILAGMAVALVGAQPCSVLISPLACGAGILGIGFAFGIVQAILAARIDIAALLSRSHVLDDFFLSVDGGIIGMSARGWRSIFPGAGIAAMIFGITLSIAVAGWLMGQPQRARQRVNHHTPAQELGGAALGTLTGAGIGLVYGLDRLFRAWMPQPFGFLLSFLIIAATWIGFSTYLRFDFLTKKQRRRRAIVTAIVHSVLAAGLVAGTFWSAGRPAGPVVLAATCGFFQSTFFTTAFVVGQKMGGARAALAATTLEGALGFAAFVIARVWHG